MKPSISVIIPAWNAAETITQCLDSLRSQTVLPEEIILVDDGSDDKTTENCSSYSVKVFSTGGRMGPATARNMGASEATGEILVFLDADVTIPSDLIEKISNHFSDGVAWAVQTLYTPICPAQNIVSQYQNHYYYYGLNRMPEDNSATFATWCAAVRRNRFHEMGGFNVRIPEPTVEDEELGYTISDCGGRIILDKSILVTHLARYNLSQFSSRRMRMARAQAKSGWRQIKTRLLARYMNVRESGTHHSRWVVLSILLVLLAQFSLLFSLAALYTQAAVLALLLLLAALACHVKFMKSAAKHLGAGILPSFALLCIYDMAVLGWGIVQGTFQYITGKKY